MADETVTLLSNLLRDQRGPLVENMRWATPFMSEIERATEEIHFDGEKVKIPIILAPKQGTGFGSESGILNTPRPLAHDKSRVDTGIAHHTVGFTSKAVLAASRVGDTGWIDVVPRSMKMAEDSLNRTINESFLGTGDALVAAVTASNAASTTIDVGADANFYALYPERIIDILVRATGAPITDGLARTIEDVDEDAGEITVDVAVTTDNTMGLYLEGSYGQAIAGMGQATATTGTFQELSKTTVPGWRGTDASPSSETPPTISIFDRAERRAAQRSGTVPAWYIGDPAVIDKFTQSLTVQARWNGEMGTLKTGWKGVQYLDKLFIKDFDVPPGTVYGVQPEDIRVYTRDDGPDWDEADGSMFKRFTRSLPYEAWLVWHLQLGFHRCNSQVKVGSLARAA